MQTVIRPGPLMTPPPSPSQPVPGGPETHAPDAGGAGLPERLIVTIDGQASTGKSSVGQKLAMRLDAAFLDTGAMYRGVTALAIEHGVNVEDAPAVLALARRAELGFDWSRFPPPLIAFGKSVAGKLRSAAVDGEVSKVAALGVLREFLVDLQRQIGSSKGRLVTEGRDQGTVVFPGAPVKFFLVADPMERARRRHQQHNAGTAMEAIYQNLLDRDRRDSSRAVGPMAVAADAIVVDTTPLSEAEVVDHLEKLVRERCKGLRAC